MSSSPYVIETSSLDLPANCVGQSLKKYILTIGAKRAIIEDRYVDKDYLLDYSGYYSRSFQDYGRYTTRIHLFGCDFDQDRFEAMLKNGEVNIIKDNYKGFIILKPFIGKNGTYEPSIGRTLLAPPLNNENQKFITEGYPVSLFGVPLKIDTLPYQTKDHAISICATIALWIANSKLSTLFQTPVCSPLEITNKATSLIESSRKIPNDGLTVRQILAFLRKMELEYNNISLHDDRVLSMSQTDRKDIIRDIVKAHIYAIKLPIIACLNMISNGSITDSHTVVISGYEEDENGMIESLYVHDDEFGPYCLIKDDPLDLKNDPCSIKFLYWKCEWNNEETSSGDESSQKISLFKFDKVMLDVIAIPLYPKIRLAFSEIYEDVVKLRKSDSRHIYELFLTTIQEYKSVLVGLNFEDKLKYLKMQMPRFIWVIRMFDLDGSDRVVVRDILYDATSHIIREIGEIKYSN